MEDPTENYEKICLEGFLKKNPSDLLAFCNCIYEHSFAVFEISGDLVEKLKWVNDENMNFFSCLSFETKMQTQGTKLVEVAFILIFLFIIYLMFFSLVQ